MIPSNPFCTRFVRPGAIRYRFPTEENGVGKNRTEKHREGEHGGRHNELAEMESICRQLHSSRAGLIIGPHGSGKSTLLHTLMPMLECEYRNVVHMQLCFSSPAKTGNRYRHSRRSWREIKTEWLQLERGDLLVIDGIEQLWLLDRLQLLSRSNDQSPALLATSHQRLLGMQVVFETKLDRQRVAELTEHLLRDSPAKLMGLVKRKLANHDCVSTINLRDFWFECYDDAQIYQRPLMESNKIDCN